MVPPRYEHHSSYTPLFYRHATTNIVHIYPYRTATIRPTQYTHTSMVPPHYNEHSSHTPVWYRLPTTNTVTPLRYFHTTANSHTSMVPPRYKQHSHTSMVMSRYNQQSYLHSTTTLLPTQSLRSRFIMFYVCHGTTNTADIHTYGTATLQQTQLTYTPMVPPRYDQHSSHTPQWNCHPTTNTAHIKLYGITTLQPTQLTYTSMVPPCYNTFTPVRYCHTTTNSHTSVVPPRYNQQIHTSVLLSRYNQQSHLYGIVTLQPTPSLRSRFRTFDVIGCLPVKWNFLSNILPTINDVPWSLWKCNAGYGITGNATVLRK